MIVFSFLEYLNPPAISSKIEVWRCLRKEKIEVDTKEIKEKVALYNVTIVGEWSRPTKQYASQDTTHP